MEENEEKQMQKDNSSDIAKQATQKFAQKQVKKFAAKSSLMGPLAHIIAVAAPILVIIIILGGIILFFLTMPGMVMEQLKAIFKEVAAGICSWFGSDDTKQVEDKEIYEALDYLEEMGYDIKGYGFLTGYKEESDVDASKNEKYDKDIGVIRDEGDKIIKADSDYIYAYLVSDNYVYTVANKNLVTQNGGGFWSKVWGGIKATAVHFYDFFGGETPNDWTRGLINIWEEDGVGGRGKFFSDTGFLNFDNISIDPKSKTLTLKASDLFNMNGSIKYSLDGWTGRYGMPLEFLLSVHIATMMPDLAYDMANTFHTKINLLLHKVTEANAIAAFKEGNNYISYEYIDSICGGFGFDSSFTTAEEAMKVMKKLGIKSPSTCTGFDSEGVGTEDVDGSKEVKNKGTDEFNDVLTKMKELGYDGDELPSSASSESDFDSYLTDVTDKKNEAYDPEHKINLYYGGSEITGSFTGTEFNKYEYYYEAKDKLISWMGNYNGESCTYSVTMNIQHYKKIVKPKITMYGDYSYYLPIDCDEEKFSVSCSEITRGWTNSEWDAAVADAKEGKTEEELENLTNQDLLGITKCSDSPDGTEKCCETCRLYIKKIYDSLKAPQDSDFDYYIPYIENVVDHWYRDVFFTNKHYDSDNNPTNSKIKFVDYDYDYEAVMNERWTAYEVDDNGEYKLYAIGKDGNYATNSNQIEKYSEDLFEKEDSYYIFKGTQEQATSQEIAVSKKAKTLTTSDEDKLSDLGWNNNSGDLWSAYKRDGASSTDWEQTYPDADTSTLEGEIKSKIYTTITSNENIVQEGEGQRTETNPKIKKMFLNNKYLKYDGTPERAEKITQLRKDKNIEYGALTTSDEEILGYASKVALNQDSLNAFSMLENTHTLDADYIYRDFKELIVELGYFTKEELTDETPRLLQWLVPAIGSGGYPDRTIDKNENEFGTMVHSKGDIDANKKNTLKNIISAAIEDASDETSDDDKDNKATKELGKTSKLDVILSELDDDFFENQNVSLGTSTDTSSGISSSTQKPSNSGSSSLLSLDEWWEENGKMFEIFKSESWTYLQDHSCATFEDAQSSGKHTTDCSLFASWSLQKVGALKDGHTFASGMGDSGSLDSSASAQDLLDAGAEVIKPNTTNFTSAANSGELEPGDVLFYDGHVSIYCGESYESGGTTYCWDTGSTTGIQGGGPRDTSYEDRPIKLIIRLPLGNKKKNKDSYQGYMGNEEVVSPVTGILLDYGTYDDDDKSSITGEKYRQNVDLKYAKTTKENNQIEPDPNGGNNNNNNEPVKNPEYDPEKPDKVGYAKILVLDAENYKKLESKTENPWQSESLVKIATKTDEEGKKISSVHYGDSKGDWILDKEDRLKDKNDDGDDSDPWTELEKTVYGYKEFAENYEMAGISGYVVYIDGFKCEKIDEEFTEEKLETEIPNKGKEDEQKISIEDFQKITEEDLKGTDLPDEEKVMPNKYEKDETHKMASKSATEKATAEAQVKVEASSTITIDDNGEKITFIKAGTVLGRTITDYELIVDYRKENYEDYRKDKIVVENPDDLTKDDPVKDDTKKDDKKDDDSDKEENLDAIIGNYLRIIMKDTDDTVVENVEDYMKLGESDSFNAVDQEYKAWEGDLEALAETMYHEAGYSYLASKSNKFATDQTEADFEMYCMGYSVVNKVIPANKDTHYGKLYDESRTDMSPLVQVVTNACARWYGFDTSHVTNKLKCYTEKELEYAEYCLTYDCTSIKKPYDTPLGAGPATDGYSTTPKDTVIPRIMCQQGGYGDGASGQSGIVLVGFWDHNNNGNFDKGDELWGVDGEYKSRIEE